MSKNNMKRLQMWTIKISICPKAISKNKGELFMIFIQKPGTEEK